MGKSGSDGGMEWYLLKNQSDLDQFAIIGEELLNPPSSLPVMAAYGYDERGQLAAIYVYPKDLITMLGYFKNQAPAAFMEVAQKVQEIQG